MSVCEICACEMSVEPLMGRHPSCLVVRTKVQAYQLLSGIFLVDSSMVSWSRGRDTHLISMMVRVGCTEMGPHLLTVQDWP
jgi:hypothetical protein